jgi:hypothetical protein
LQDQGPDFCGDHNGCAKSSLLAITTAWNWWSSGGSECLSDVNAGAVAADFEQRP